MLSAVLFAGAFLASVVMGGPILLAAISVVIYLAVRHWSQTITPLSQSAIGIIVLGGIVYLSELYVTMGSAASSLIVPFLAMTLLFSWQVYAQSRNFLEDVGQLMIVFLLIPYSLGFLVLLRDLPQTIGFWSPIAAVVGSVSLSISFALTKHLHRLWNIICPTIIGLLTTAFFVTRIDAFFEPMTVLTVAIITVVVGYLGLIVYLKIQTESNIFDWLMIVLSTSFSAPILYFALTLLG
jgi:hypothetical protein